jgi:sulfur-oxidizing protein SoxX
MWKNIVVSVVTFFLTIGSYAVYAADSKQANVEQGKRLALKHCPACHNIAGADQAGTVAAPLKGIKARFPNRKKLYNIIYNAQSALNKDTMMPPFGRNELLDKGEIKKIIDFLYTI